MIETIRLVVVVTAAVLLVTSAALVLIRIERGPSTLDRVVAADVMVVVVIGGLALEAAIDRHATTLPIMVVLSLLGFAGSISLARFVADRDKARKWNVPDTADREL
jgi:multicomponent Na+:H+ antiporter subunit F